MEKTVRKEGANGAIYRYDRIPHNMFDFYLLKQKTFQNGESLWHLCVKVAVPSDITKVPACVHNYSNWIKLQSFRGTKAEAEKQLDTIVEAYT